MYCLGTWHRHSRKGTRPGAPQPCLSARSPSLGTGTPCTHMLWDCPTFTPAILASNPQLGSPARCPEPARSSTCPGPDSRCHQRWARRTASRGEPWGGRRRSGCRLSPVPHCPRGARTAPVSGYGSAGSPAGRDAEGAPRPPAAPRSRGGVAAPFRSVSPGQSRPSRAPLAPGALYHAVRGGWPSPSRHRAVTEPGCRLSTHLMSEPLRCRQPRSRHRLRPRTPSTGGSAPDPAPPAAAGPGPGQPGRCPLAPRCPRLLPTVLRCPPGPP